jgi:hypothetical protein
MISRISLSEWTKFVFTSPPCQVARPVGFSTFPARSIPLMIFFFSSHTTVWLYMQGSSLDALTFQVSTVFNEGDING